MRMNRPRYAVVEMSQHWRIIDGEFYRDCTVRDRRTGTVRARPVRDELLRGVA